MGQLPRDLAVAGLLVAGLAAPAVAQQGSVQVSGSAQTVHGDPSRRAGQSRLEPDFGVTWLQPGTKFGAFQMELRGTRRGPEPHLGRTFVAWRDVKLRGAAWTFEAGDLYFTPVLGDYRFSNLSPPALTFAGVSISAQTPRSHAALIAGRSTAWRNIFGSDPDTLGQDVALLRGRHKILGWLELNARASHVRTRNVKEFSYTISASDQAGAGARVLIGPRLQLVADGSYIAYRRRGSDELVHDGSATAGGSFVHSRGWLQFNASKFSPGDFPVLNYTLVDRRTTFVAGEQDLFKYIRLFGGWEKFQGNLDPLRAKQSGALIPDTSGARTFGGIRIRLFERSSLAFRVEEGDRRTRRNGSSIFTDSDTGVFSGELQSRFGPVTSFLRYSQRENVESFNGGSYQQSDGTAQFFVSLSRNTQLFGTAMATRNTYGGGGGSTYYQFGGGGQFQLANRTLWMRLEGLAARNQDMVTQNLVARESISVGLNGQIAHNTTIGLNLYSERAPSLQLVETSWLTRSTLRVTRSFATGTARIPGVAGTAARATRARGTGTVTGSIFADWDGDGIPDPDEGPLEGIPILLGTTGATTTSPRGEFTFTNVPAGLQRVQLDLSALPVDFDPPEAPSLQIEVSRGDTQRVAFGLIPLGMVTGRVLRDANGNGTLDAADEPVDGAVVVLDGGLRSEQARKGRYRFDAVRSGGHTLDLLVESMPEGAAIIGDGRVEIALTREMQTRIVDFLVRIDKRPEIRKVFPPKGGGQPAAAQARGAGARTTPPARTRPSQSAPARPAPETAEPSAEETPEPRARAARTFTIQIAALSQLTRAQELVAELKRADVSAYITRPPDDDPNGLYRIRVGRYPSRAAANRALVKLEKLRGEKLWVIRER